MRACQVLSTASIIAAVVAYMLPTAQARTTMDMGPAALAGTVSSAKDGAMEGVLVSARKDGSNITVTVVSDAKGHYAFPAARLTPGHYAFSIRAAGYDLAGPGDATVAASKPTTADITLKETVNLDAQLTNAEWLNSIPGTDDQKQFMASCVTCHTLERVFTSKFTSEDFERLIPYMGTIAPGSVPGRRQMLSGGNRGHENTSLVKHAAEYLASVNLSRGARAYPLKTLPRPSGRATHVIVTTYDLPRKEAMAHDVVAWPGSPGRHIWYSDFASEYIGELDPKSGKVTDYPLPVRKPNEPKGSLDLVSDQDNNLWIAMMYQSAIARFDTKTKQVTVYPFPGDSATSNTHAGMVAPDHWHTDGKVWSKISNDVDHRANVNVRLDVKTGRWENVGLLKDQNGYELQSYEITTDKDNNLYMLDFGGTKIGRVDAKTHSLKSWGTAFEHSRPRRGHFDAEKMLWFAEYEGNAVGEFDPKTEKIHEWRLPLEWSFPYDALRDKQGNVWTGSMFNDRATRLNPQTGEFIDYLLPATINIRRVTFDDATHAFWVGDALSNAIVRVEALD